ncbi:NEP1-interacting protein-like 1 [Gracilariopsis chorda]|uniref:NEP1-interacting protein-like 1 n=1 Tax=Gracilariopsis chorda TaxID=448386 RepID=A0A2V3J4F3_9FLOR|nr:NEP1-interacting protein-like 1 [Gracilariopsis chorda]|eukprot:PXF49298.1 NEP1-interacting protein-like 1 [Gracilariopsis chorda]
MPVDVVIYVLVAVTIALTVLILLSFLYVQRRRQRAMQLLALAQEEADRRRRKKKKVALRRWEIDNAAPEALVHRVVSNPNQYTLTLKSNPDLYIKAVTALRTAGHLPPDLVQPPETTESTVPTEPDLLEPPVTEPPPISDTAPSSGQLPRVLVAIPPTETNCVICLEPIIVGQRVRSLPCHHIYHSQCIRIWLRRKNACPCCCERVVLKRRKRQNNSAHPPPQTSDRQPTLVQPIPRFDDRGERNALHATLSRNKSSFLSRQSDDISLDRFNSDTTSQLDEQTAEELLSQVRRALRGQSSMLSIGTTCSATPSDTAPSHQLVSAPNECVINLSDFETPSEHAETAAANRFLHSISARSVGSINEPTEAAPPVADVAVDIEAISPAP